MNVHGDISALIEAANDGGDEALRALFAQLYRDLKQLAHKQLSRSPGNTLNTTALVHEAYLKLAPPAALSLKDRGHFFALTAKAMRQIVVDHARARLSDKRGGADRCVVELDAARGVAAPEFAAEELLRLDAALAHMETEEPQLAQVVELRFFAGIGVAEIATIQAVSERTVVRNWRRAKVRLFGELHPEA